MNILHLNTFDVLGGAARAAHRIHTALRENNIHSEMLVGLKVGQDTSVKEYPVRFKHKKLEYSQKILDLQKSENPTYHTCNIFPSGIYRAINRSSADIVHFHWIGNELISIAEVKKINKPIVWTLHDMWAFSGAEHYDDLVNPGRYKQAYSTSSRSRTYAGIIDVDGWVWRRKKKQWHNIDFSFVTPSKWLATCLGESALFAGEKASVIPNLIKTDVFQPTEKKIGRKFFNLSQDKQLILFGADGGGQNPLKGYHLLEKALGYFARDNSVNAVECVVFGGKAVGRGTIKGIPVTEVGRINDDNKLAMLYSSADVFVIPSMLDNLPNTVLEAMSCGVPCVGFAIGGIPDMIDHQETGFLVEPFSTRELAKGICWVLEDFKRLARLGQQAREKVMVHYASAVVAEQYIALYEKVLEGDRGKVLAA